MINQYEMNRGKHLTLFSLANLAMLSDWLEESGELYIDVYLPHSASSSTGYFIRSIAELKTLVAEQWWDEIVFTIFREIQFPLRGVADKDLLQQALRQMQEGQPYYLLRTELSVYPNQVAYSYITTSNELQEEITQFHGQAVAFGPEPKIYDLGWLPFYKDEVFEVYVLRQHDYQPFKNHEDYAPYRQNPERYQFLADLWQSEN
jgi:hypothetical protein